MDENFYQSKSLPKEALHQLMKRKNHPASLHFMVMYALFIGLGYWVVIAWGQAWWQVIFSQLAFAIVCCSTFAALHETAHHTAFSSKKLNHLTAHLAGLAHIYPAHLFRELHFTHHRHTHVPGLDPEISLGNKAAPSVIQTFPMYFGWISGFPLFFFKIGMTISGALGMPEFLRKELFPFVRPQMRFKIWVESSLVLAFYTLLLLLAIYVHNGFWGIFVGQLVGHCLLANYLIMEHNGLPHEGHILEKTRSIQTNKFVKLVMWNMPYHAEHHAYPAVPFHALPDLHQAIKKEILHQKEGHPEFHWNTLKKTLLGKS